MSQESHSRPTQTAVGAGSPRAAGAVLGQARQSLVAAGPQAAESLLAPVSPASPVLPGSSVRAGAQAAEVSRPAKGRHILFVAWRDLANPRAGGSEVLVDRLAEGMTTRGDRVTVLCGGPTAPRGYQVIRNGGSYTQFLRAPLVYQRRLRDCDLVVEVCNGMPFFAPLWARRPMVCLVNHVHTELWGIRLPPPLAAVGRFTESVLMPWAHRKNLFLTISPSTAAALTEIGVEKDQIRLACTGVELPQPLTPRSPEPMFLALGRAARERALRLQWSVAVEAFAKVADEAMARDASGTRCRR